MQCTMLQMIVAKDVYSGLGDLLKGLLKIDPAKRLKAREALNHQFFRTST